MSGISGWNNGWVYNKSVRIVNEFLISLKILLTLFLFRLRCVIFFLSDLAFLLCGFLDVPLAQAAAWALYCTCLVEGSGVVAVSCFVIEAPRDGVGPLLMFL